MNKVVLFVFALMMSVASGVYAGKTKPAGSKADQDWRKYPNACDYDRQMRDTKSSDRKETREQSRKVWVPFTQTNTSK
jgi:hypothetical protein